MTNAVNQGQQEPQRNRRSDMTAKHREAKVHNRVPETEGAHDSSEPLLFRREAINHQRDQAWGAVLIQAPISFSLLAGLAVLIVVAAITFLSVGEYARKQTVRGYLMPVEGVVKLFAEDRGQFAQVLVTEHQLVKKGDPLIEIVKQRADGLESDVYKSRLQEIEVQIKALQDNIDLAKRNVEIEQEQRDRVIAQTASEVALLESQLKTQLSRVELAKKRYQRMATLNTKNLVARARVEEEFDDYLVQTDSAQQIEQQLLNRQNRLAQQQAQKERDQLSAKEGQNRLLSQLSFLRERRIELEGERSILITAPTDGRVTGIQARAGETVLPSIPMLSILPEKEQFQVHLYLPTHVIGSIETDQPVRIKFDAFPYQKFGFYDGAVEEISKTIFTPKELDVPVTLRGPVYRVIASLEHDKIHPLQRRMDSDTHENQKERTINLQSGMTLTADIIYDKRTILDWIIEPLQSLTM